MQVSTYQAGSQESLILWREIDFLRHTSAHRNVSVLRRRVKHTLEVPVSLL